MFNFRGDQGSGLGGPSLDTLASPSFSDVLPNWPPRKYVLQVNNRNTRARCEICSKLTIKTPEPPLWSRSGVFIVNFEHISHFVLVLLLLTLG